MEELPRRLWHIGGGLSLPIAGLLVPQQIFLPALISLTTAFLLVEAIRLSFPGVNRRLVTCFQALLREREASTLTASAYLLIAACSVFILYDKSIAAIALTFVALGDPVAGMVGGLKEYPPHLTPYLGRRRKKKSLVHPSSYLARGVWGRRGIRNKSLSGSCACLVICLAAGAILAAITHVALWVVVVGAICATLVEFLSLWLNDNLTIPLVAGGVMMLVKLVCL